MPCQCQWGLSGIFLGIIILLAAGCFSAFPAFFPSFYPGLFSSWWYIDLCIFWAVLGASLLSFGCLYECCTGCGKKKAKAREFEYLDVEGLQGTDASSPPAPYVMITG